MIDRIAERWLATLEMLRRNRSALSGISLVIIFVVSVTYLTFGALRINPARSTIEVRIPLAESGGLLRRQDVTLRGVPIGRVDSVVLADGGVTAVASIDSRIKIPVDSAVRVSGLSPAGEQYLDFRPAASTGPYLIDGSVIDPDRTSVPVTLAQTLANANGALTQLDPEKLEIIRQELGVSVDGPDKLADILDGGTFLISALDGVLPETVSLLSTSQMVFSTVVDVDPGVCRDRSTSRIGVRRHEPDGRWIPHPGCARTREPAGHRRSLRRQLRDHGALVGEPRHRRRIVVCARACVERAVPRSGRARIGAGEYVDRFPRRRGVGHRRYLPALRLRLRGAPNTAVGG